MMIRKLNVILVLICSSASITFAQIWNPSDDFFQKKPDIDSLSQGFKPYASALFFFKNNEYVSSTYPGFTLFGNFSEAGLVFKSENYAINAGVAFGYQFGEPRRYRLLPVLTGTFSPYKNFKIQMGTLDGPNGFNLPQELYGPDYFLQNPLEYGLKINWHPSFLDARSWLSWQQNIVPHENFQERFVQGNSMVIKLMKISHWEIAMPLNLLFYHRGGQIDQTNLPAVTDINLGGGLKLKHDIGPLRHFTLSYIYLRSEKGKGNADWLTDNGRCHTVMLHYQMPKFQSGLVFRDLKGFHAPMGEGVFNSFNVQYLDWSLFDRNHLSIYLFYDLMKTKNVGLRIGGEAYYMLSGGSFEYNYSIMGRFKIN